MGMNAIRASESTKIKKGLLIKKRDETAPSDPRKSPIFQRTIESGMKASGRRRVGAPSLGTTDVIFVTNTEDTEEMQRQEKLASAGHLSVDDHLAQTEVISYALNAGRAPLRGIRKPRAPSDARPTTRAEKKYPIVKEDIFEFPVVSVSKYAVGNTNAEMISK